MRILSLLAAVASFFVLTACGSETETEKEAELHGEAAWVPVGPVSYQVQISRQLNPSDEEDVAYLEGISKADQKLRPDQSYFGVFLRAQNRSSRPQTPAHEFEIVDTQGAVYRPVPLASGNFFAYRPQRITGEGVIPIPDSAAANGPIQGSLLLFKITDSSFQDRPLILEIKQGGKVGEIELDV